MERITRVMILILCFSGFWFPSDAETASKKNKTVVGRNNQSIPKADFYKRFHEYICRGLGKDESDIVVSSLKVTGNKPVPAGEVNIQLFQKDKRKLSGNVRLVAVISVNGVAKNKVKLSGWVDLFESVVCTTRNLKRGDTITEEDVYLERRNIAHLPPNLMFDINKVTGFMVKHQVKADSCIKEWMLEKAPIVGRGDIVTIIAETGGLKVAVPGRILIKGYEGELVRVQNLMSQKEIYAEVVNPETVTVAF
jgi:flagella basal body P-ring formation protein FlgA